MTEKYVYLDSGEEFYIADSINVKTLTEFKEEFSDPGYEYTEEEIERVALEEYHQSIYENSMPGKEIVDIMNRLYEENIRTKQLLADFYNNERTAIGRSVIQQILEAL